jgi:hypothetical protein
MPESMAQAVWNAGYTKDNKARPVEVALVLFWLVKRAAMKKRDLESAREIAGRLGWSHKTIGKKLTETVERWDEWNGRIPERRLCATPSPAKRHPLHHGFDIVEEASATCAPPLTHLGAAPSEDLSLYCAGASACVTDLQASQKDISLHRPAGASEDSSEAAPAPAASQPIPPKDNHSLPLAAVSGTGRGLIWGDLVRDLETAGYQSLGELAEAGRDAVAGDLGKSASGSRLDRIQRCLHSRALLADGQWTGTSTGRPASRGDETSRDTGPSQAFLDRIKNARPLRRIY